MDRSNLADREAPLFHFLRFILWARRSRSTGLASILLLVVLALFGNAICFYHFDGPLHESLTFGDAMWYSLVSVTTIGYGDFYAQSVGARLGAMFFIMVVGLSAFTLLLGVFADTVTDFIQRGRRGMARIMHENHLLIVNFPSVSRLRQVLRELRNDPQNENQEVVILTDVIEELPFSMKRVSFVQGSPMERESYERANLEKASTALVLSPDYSDPHSDAVVSSIVAVIENINSGVYTVAECLDDSHRILFRSSHCDSIVCGPQLSSNLLSQELHDPGVAQTLEVVTSNLKGLTFFSTHVTDETQLDYPSLARGLMGDGVNVLSVIREEEVHTAMEGVKSSRGDRVVYLARQRLRWEEMKTFATA